MGQQVGSAPLARAGFGALASVGGVALVVAAVAAVAIARGLLADPVGAREMR